MFYVAKKGIINKYSKESEGRFLKQDISLKTPYITLGQLLKIADLIQTGGQAKWFLAENDVYVNEALESRRGKKLYSDDVIKVNDRMIKLKAGK